MKALAVKGLTQVNDPNDPVQELNLKGEISVIEFENEELVKKCYDFIGTDIVQAVHLPMYGVTMWIDEEGKLKNNVLPNLDATFMYLRQIAPYQDVIMGHAVFTSDKTDDEGWALGLTDAEIEKLKNIILQMQSKRPDTAFATDVLNHDPREKTHG